MDAGTSGEVIGLGATLLNVGMGVLVGAAIMFLTAVVWLYRSKFRDLKAMLVVAMALIMMPAGLRLVQEKTEWFTQAKVEVRVENLQVAATGPGEVMVYFTTSRETIAFVEYTDAAIGKTTAFFPQYPIARQVGHAVPIKGVGQRGGRVTFVVDGQKVGYQGRPVEIK